MQSDFEQMLAQAGGGRGQGGESTVPDKYVQGLCAMNVTCSEVALTAERLFIYPP